MIDFPKIDNLDILPLSGIKKKSLESDEQEIIFDATATPHNGKRSTVIKRHSKYIYRRAYSETQLLDIVNEPFEYGYTYNFLTAGDVDSLSYLKIIMRQQNLEHLLFSTWCMAQEDIFQIRDWINAGRIKKADAYVGEIFPNSYKLEYKLLIPIIESSGGRVCVCKNHSKVFAGYGEKFYFGIQTSANINTNPRIENGSITIDKDIYHFYNEFYSGLISYNKDKAE